MVMDRRDIKVPFEEALDQTGFGLYNILLMAVLSFTIIASIILHHGITIIVPSSACELGTTSAQQGLIVGIPTLGTIIGTLIWGYLSDTQGRRKTLIMSMCSGAVVNMIASISVNWIMLLVLQVTTSFLSGGGFIVSMTLLSESVPLNKRNAIVLFVSSSVLLGQVVNSAIAIPIMMVPFSYYLPVLDIFWNSWRTLHLTCSLLGLLCSLFLYFMQESPKFLLAKGDDKGALKILKVIHRINNGKKAEELQVKGLLPEFSTEKQKSGAKDQIVMLFKPPYLKYILIMASLFLLFHFLVALMLWIPTVMNKFMHHIQLGNGSDLTLCEILLTDSDASVESENASCSVNTGALLILMFVGCIQAAFNTTLSLIVNKIGRRNTSIVVSIVCGLAGVLINLVPSATGSAVLYVVFSLGVDMMGLYTAMSVALFPTNLRTLAVAMTMTCGHVASVGLIQVANYLLTTSCDLGFYTFASLFGSSAFILLLLPDDRTMRQTKTDNESQGKYNYNTTHDGSNYISKL